MSLDPKKKQELNQRYEQLEDKLKKLQENTKHLADQTLDAVNQNEINKILEKLKDLED